MVNPTEILRILPPRKKRSASECQFFWGEAKIPCKSPAPHRSPLGRSLFHGCRGVYWCAESSRQALLESELSGLASKAADIEVSHVFVAES